MNPEDLARRRWKAVNKKVEERERLVQELNQASDCLAALREELPRAEQADREAFAAALAQGKPEPARSATELAAKIESEERRAEAAAFGIETTERELRELCAANGDWRSETLRAIAKKRSAYQKSIAQLEPDREALADEVALIGWLADGGSASPANDTLSGGVTANGRPAYSFNQLLLALNEDAEEIATHLREPGPRLPWQRIKSQAEALIGSGLSREEAMRHAGPSGWGDE